MISLTRFTHSQHTWGINAAGNDTYSTSHIRPLMIVISVYDRYYSKQLIAVNRQLGFP